MEIDHVALREVGIVKVPKAHGAGRRPVLVLLAAVTVVGCSAGRSGRTSDAHGLDVDHGRFDANSADAIPPLSDRAADAGRPVDATRTQDASLSADASPSADANIFFAPSVESAEALNRAVARFDACLTKQLHAEVWTTDFDYLLAINPANYGDEAGGDSLHRRLYDCDRTEATCEGLIACNHVVDAPSCVLEDSASAPSLTKGITTGVYYRYGRVKLVGGTGNTIVNVDAGLLALG